MRLVQRFLNLVLAFGIAITTLPAQAAVPGTLNYQGQLINAAGAPVNAAVNITFKLYDAAILGNLLWSETQSVTVSNGLYSATLGQTTPLTPALFGAPLYLGISVGADTEMTPRIALGSSATALRASLADSAATATTATSADHATTAATASVASTLSCTGCISAAHLAAGAAVSGPQGPAGPQGPQGVAGTAGATGATGATGANGKTVLSGAGAPAAGLGVDGDFYINTVANAIYAKAAGVWGGPTSLVGPAGATGATGVTGSQGPQGLTGLTGATGPQGPVGATGATGANGKPS